MRSSFLTALILMTICFCASACLWGQQAPWGYEEREPAPPPPLMPIVIENRGQFDPSVRFIIPGSDGTVVFARDSITLVLEPKADVPAPTAAEEAYLSLLPSDVREAAVTRRRPMKSAEAPEVIRIRFADSDSDAAVVGLNRQSARANWLVGKDSSKWVRDLQVFEGLEYRNLWPGTNLVFAVNFGRLTCTAEGAGAKLELVGKGSIEADEVNRLLAKALGEPSAVQGMRTMIDRQGICIAGTAYTPVGGGTDVSSDFQADCFVLQANASGKLSWITFLGGSSDDTANAVSVDRHGYVFVTGFTRSDDLPVTGKPYRAEHNGHQDYFTMKLAPSGSSIAYCSYLGVGGGGLGLEPFAARWSSPKGEKLLAIMIDDGREEAQIKPFLDLGIPVTFAVMPWIDPPSIRLIRSRGSAAFLHAPMEALGSANTRSEEVRVMQTEAQVEELLEGWLVLTPGVVGVSNHRGSAATSDPETMRRVVSFAKKHGLMWYDSNTAPVSVGVNVGRGMNVPCLQQDFFLDERDVPSVRARLLAMAALAERTGYATCICHVGRSVVPEGIKSVIPELQARGFRFVTVPELYERISRQ